MSHVYLGYDTAFTYWRHAKDGALTLQNRQSSHLLNRAAANSAEVAATMENTVFRQPGSPFEPTLHVVSDSPGCANSTTITFHRPHRKSHLTFVDLGKGVFMSTPELSFLQAAQVLSLEKTIEYGYSLCGTYALCPDSKWGSVTREPLSTTKKLETYLTSCAHVKGVKQALRALQYVQDGSASPRETQAAMALTLPKRLGGQGLPPAALNAHIGIPAQLSSATRRNYFVADMLWKDGRVALEYDSDLKHANSEGIAEDSVKRNTLITMGYTPFGLTRLQLNDPSATHQAAESIRRALHIKADRRLPQDYPQKVAHLRREIGLPTRQQQLPF